ncbi:SRPBCC family protein [Paenibacillus koleovorans]|uniref:SRPBCC family protein n=1 Tax=Paenibacillus koleovorans TaxID=121608 RepID=UPI000FDA4C6C|nr:SRPBCC family protein [Paenibacillus koleovorans]
MSTTITAEPGTQEILTSRVFDAPRDLVYSVYTDPTTVPDWYGPAYLTTVVDQMEVKKGGVFRYIQRDPSGGEHCFNGVYHTCRASELLVHTFEYEGAPDSIGLVTITFEDAPGGMTKLTEVSLFPSVEVRDAVVNSGMEAGARELMDRLAALLAKKQGK